MLEDGAAIGVFDSGVGGLTVVRRIVERLPHEPVIYLGDTARVPYGTKSPETVIRYAESCARVLTARGIKVLVVACNTASAHALHVLQDSLEVPVVGVVEPGARAAAAQTRNGRIGIIGTQGTIASGEYQRAICAVAPEAEIVCQACPLFVPLAEEGWTEGEVPRRVAEEYLSRLKEHEVDTLVLGCTHYPMLAGVIGEVMTTGVALVDSAEATSAVVQEVLRGMNLEASPSGTPRRRFLVSDGPEGFALRGRHFLAHAIDDVEWVDF